MNAVGGVDLNTASVPLLSRVSGGVSESLAEAIVAYREKTGPFRSRTALLDVPRLGPKAFEQCAGFLRIRGGDDALDASGGAIRRLSGGAAHPGPLRHHDGRADR